MGTGCWKGVYVVVQDVYRKSGHKQAVSVARLCGEPFTTVFTQVNEPKQLASPQADKLKSLHHETV